MKRGDSAFNYCYGLTECVDVTIPDSVYIKDDDWR